LPHIKAAAIPLGQEEEGWEQFQCNPHVKTMGPKGFVGLFRAGHGEPFMQDVGVPPPCATKCQTASQPQSLQGLHNIESQLFNFFRVIEGL